MIPWKLLDTAPVPGTQDSVRLYQRDSEFSIRVDRFELMNSRVYASEDALSELGCARIKARPKARVLIGGLGMGYSLRTALHALADDAEVVVSELVPAVVSWNRDARASRSPSARPARHDPGGRRGAGDPRSSGCLRRDLAGCRQRARRLDAQSQRLDLRAARSGGSARGAAARGCRFAVQPGSGVRAALVPRRVRGRRDRRARGARGKGSRHTIWLAVPRLRRRPLFFNRLRNWRRSPRAPRR